MKIKRYICIFLCALLLAGCASDAGDGEEQIDISDDTRIGGILTLQMRVPETLDPLKTTQQTVREALGIIYEPLFYIGADYKIEPCLAVSAALGEDARSVTINLKSGVYWHDGASLDARDVVSTVNRIINDQSSPYREKLKYVSSAAAIDDMTVRLSLSRAYSQILYALDFPIVPDHANVDSAPCGTGPYYSSEYDPLQSLVLKRYAAYHGDSPNIERIEIAFIKSNEIASAAFATGRVSAATSSVLDLANNPLKQGMGDYDYPSEYFEFLTFNYDSVFLQSAVLRSAISSCIDRDAVIEMCLGGGATAATLPINSPVSEIQGRTTYNIEHASEALSHDGWADDDGDGRLEKTVVTKTENEDGEITEEAVTYILEFSILVNSENERRLAAAQAIAEQMKSVGIGASVVALDADGCLAALESGGYDMFLGGCECGVHGDVEPLLKTRGAANYGGYSDPDMDAALSAYASAASAQSQSDALYILGEIFERDTPIVGLWFLSDTLVTGASVGGDIAPSVGHPYSGIQNWYVKAQ